MLAEQLTSFISSSPGDDSESRFGELAVALFEHLLEADADYRRLVEQADADPASVDDWRAIPILPDVPPEAVADESLATLARRSALRLACMSGLERPPILAAGPALDELTADLGGPGSKPEHRLSIATTRSWLAGRQRDGRPVLLVLGGAATEELINGLERQDLRFRLAVGSRLVTTHGALSSTRVSELVAAADSRLGLGDGAVLAEIAWPAIATPAYASCRADGTLEPFQPPHWVRIRALDSATEAELPDGVEGSLGVLDLATLGAGLHRLTETRGHLAEGSVYLAERAAVG